MLVNEIICILESKIKDKYQYSDYENPYFIT